jgi:hypothetical protein
MAPEKSTAGTVSQAGRHECPDRPTDDHRGIVKWTAEIRRTVP